MATGTAPVMPAIGAAAAITKKTIPKIPIVPFLRPLPSTAAFVSLLDTGSS
jgi:hypothetical protein